MAHNSSELIRLRYKYRRMILRGEVKLPLDAAKQLVGPDCAYHLYFMVGNEESPAPVNKTKPSLPARRKNRR